MGKGGTKFEGQAIGQRTGKSKGYTTKERTKDMEDFKLTGKHPEIEEVRARAAAETLHPMPDVDLARPRTFIEFTLEGKPIGRVIVEVFLDLVPMAARAFLNRCRPGATGSLQGTSVDTIMPGLGVYAGRSTKYKAVGEYKPSAFIRHVEPGTVSINASGNEVVFGLARSLTLDASHLVIGRVQSGQEVIAEIVSVGTDPHDAPLLPVRIARCGLASVRGIPEEDDSEAAAARKAETPEQTIARMKRETAAAQDGLRQALEAGLLQKSVKRKADDLGVVATAEVVVAPKLKGGRFDTLGDVSSDSSEEDA